MTATTVPPPGWHPIGAPELRANARRFFSRALAISGAGHLVILAAVLWLQSRVVETEPRLNEATIHVIPIPPSHYDVPMPPRDILRVAKEPPDVGIPIPKPDFRADLPTMSAPVTEGPDKRVEDTGAAPGPGPTNDPALDRIPAEGQFVAYDREPVPYYRPAPEYPTWARDAGIEGRVVLHVLVGRDGRVARMTVIRNVEGLTDAAREAIARWLFHPALSGKNPVAVWVEIPIEFRL